MFHVPTQNKIHLSTVPGPLLILPTAEKLGIYLNLHTGAETLSLEGLKKVPIH